MRLLLHIGLNKCASSFIQHRLRRNASALAEAGVLYPVEAVGNGQFGLSKHYGFGPMRNEAVEERSIADVARLAREQDATAVILSSEYFSLNRPEGITKLLDDIRSEGFELSRVLFFARPVEPWLRSLFNQYIRSIDTGPYLGSIDAYLDQVMRHGELDIAGRFRAWQAAVGADRIRLIDIRSTEPRELVLRPFESFAGIELTAGHDVHYNSSLPPGVLHILGLVRRAPPSEARSELIRTLFDLDHDLARAIPAPAGYDTISEDRLERIRREIEEPFAALPRAPLEPAAEQATAARVA